MENNERIEKMAAGMREFTDDDEQLASYSIGAIRGCVGVNRDGRLDDATALDHIREVLAAEALVRAERQDQ